MIKNWRNKVGLFLGSIISWLPQKYGSVTPPAPSDLNGFSTEVNISRSFTKNLFIARSPSLEVEL